MKHIRLQVLDRLSKGELTPEEADDELAFLYTMHTLFLGEDSEGNEIKVGDTVIRDGDNECLISFDTYRGLFDCGDVIGYYVPDNCTIKTT